MMIAVYIIIGVAIGAAVLFLAMNPKVGRLHVELARKETELQLLGHQRQEERQQSEERFAQQIAAQREQTEQQMAAQREKADRQMQAARDQFDEQLRTTKEQLANMARQLMDLQAQKRTARAWVPSHSR